MPIQIIPKEAAKLPLWQNIMFYFSIGLLFSVLGGYGILFHFTKKATEDAKKFEEIIQQGKTQQILTLENEMKTYRDKIDNFSSLIANHKLSSNFFGDIESKTGILEKSTHPRVMFFEMLFDVKSNTITLSGVTENLEIVGQQVVLFQNNRMVKNVKLTKIIINKEGKIEFTLDVSIDPVLLTSFCGDKIIGGEEECDGEKEVPENFICTSECKLESF